MRLVPTKTPFDRDKTIQSLEHERTRLGIRRYVFNTYVHLNF